MLFGCRVGQKVKRLATAHYSVERMNQIYGRRSFASPDGTDKPPLNFAQVQFRYVSPMSELSSTVHALFI